MDSSNVKQSTRRPDWPDAVSEGETNELWSDFTRRAVWISPYRPISQDEHPETSSSKADSPIPPPGYEYAEHMFLGNQMKIKYQHPKSDTDQTPDGKEVEINAYQLPLLKLGEGFDVAELTYGEISALAGDFYGTLDPISDGQLEKDRIDRFMAAYNTLADNPKDQPGDVQALLHHLQEEVDTVEKLYKEGKDPSTYYKGGTGLAGLNAIDKLIKGRHFPIYSELLKINWDHFGDDARTAYVTGHLAAMRWAADGEKTVDRLVKAYSMSAFADHYLQDLFSAGHLRTPRRLLHGGVKNVVDICANKMHDEDCALGLTVADPKGNKWQAYGDKRLLDKDNLQNLLKCQVAMLESAREVYDAWDTKTITPTADFKALAIAPTKESAFSTTQTLAPLFKYGPKGIYEDLQRRQELKDRRIWRFKSNWWAATTVAETYSSGLWDYPMHM